MQDFVFALFLGLGPGAVFAILAVGVVVAYRGSGVINFAHGAIAMYVALTFNRLRADENLGGAGDVFLPWVDIIPDWDWLVALRLNNLPVRITVGPQGMGTFPAVLISLAMAALLGVLAHVVVFRRLRDASALSKIIASVGIMIYLQALAFIHFGTRLRSDPGWGVFTPDQEPVRNFLGLDSNFPRASLYLALCAGVLALGVWTVIRFTRFGLAARAVDENERAMVMLGYSADQIAMITWIFAAMVAGAVGIIYVGFTQPSNMVLLIVPALGAALVGRLTSVIGAALGGFGIAMIQSGGVYLAGREAWPDWLPASGVRQFVPLLIIMLVLFVSGDRLPVRGSLVNRGEPRAPTSSTPVRTMGRWAIFVVFFALLSDWKIESGLTSTLVAGIFMLSIVVLMGFLGQISLANWSIAGLAAFTMIRLAADGSLVRPLDGAAKAGLGWPDPLAALGGVLIAVVAGVIIGIPAVRVRGLQLAVISISAVIAIEDLLLGNPSIMGAGADSNNPTPEPNWFGFYVGASKEVPGNDIAIGTPDNPAFTVLVLVLAVVCGIAVAQLRRGGTGRRFLAIRSNERAAAAMGVHVPRTKLLGFALSSALAGLAGVLFVYKLPSVGAPNFGLLAGLVLLAFAYIAGITTVSGAFVGGMLVGGGFLSSLSESEAGSGFTKYNTLIAAGGMLAAALMANGEGVLRLRDRWERWREHWNDKPAELEAWGRAGRIPVLVLGGIAASDFISRGGLSIALDDLQDEFGFSDFRAGLLPFADVIAGAAVIVLAGYLADKMNRTRLLTGLMVIWAILSASTGLIGGFVHLFILRTALGAMTAIDDPASSSLLSDFYPAKIRHKAFSWRLVAPVLGGAFGNLAIGLAIDNWGWRWAFAVSAVPAVILIWFVSRLPEPERGASDEEPKSNIQRSWRADLAAMRRVKSVPLMIAASALSFGPAVGVTFWAPTFLRRHHDLTAGEAAGLFGFASLAGALLGAWIASRGPEKFGHIRHIKIWIAGLGSIVGILLLMLAYSATPVSLKFPLLLAGAAALVAANPILVALISQVTPASIRGSVFSVNSFCRLALSALAPLTIGLVADQVRFIDRGVPVPSAEIVAAGLPTDEFTAVEDRADRYECEDGRVVIEEDDPDDDLRAGRSNYECGDDEVGHLGAGMVAVLAIGATSGLFAIRARRYLDDDIIANGGTPDEVVPRDVAESRSDQRPDQKEPVGRHQA